MIDHYMVPKALVHSDIYKNINSDAAVLYAFLFDKTIVSELDSDVILDDDGRKLFISCPFSEMASDLQFDEELICILISELTASRLLRVVEQPNGNPPVIFVFAVLSDTQPPGPSFENSNIVQEKTKKAADITHPDIDIQDIPPKDMPAPVAPVPAESNDDCDVRPETAEIVALPENSSNNDEPPPEHRPIFEAWLDVFGNEADDSIKNSLLKFLDFMDADLIRYAIFSAEDDTDPSAEKTPSFVHSRLNYYINHNYKTVGMLPDSQPSQKTAPPAFPPSYSPDPVSHPIVPPPVVPQPVVPPLPYSAPSAEPAPISQSSDNRIVALQAACNNEFSPCVVQEFWVSMQDYIDESHWDDLPYLSNWLSEKYNIMHSKLAGGDMIVRSTKVQDLINNK